MPSHSLDEQLCRLLQELQALSLSEEVSVSPELTSFLERKFDDVGDAAERSPLQIELILRSLNPSSAKPQVRASL